ncbi:MAG: serine/threonine-protein kinase [Polynucleobacter sp.]|nr:serine/threonine-protein kinase [Polynucleobacter sp.]
MQVQLDATAYNVIDVKDGGMGRVWMLERPSHEDYDPVYRKRLAVKTFDFTSDVDAVERELNIWVSLSHPSIVPLLKIGRLNYRLAAVMPLMEGSLFDLLERQGPLGERKTANIMFRVVEALASAWKGAGVLHLDLKPQNILYISGSSYQPKVSDWGISRLASSASNYLGGSSSVFGSAATEHRTKFSAGTPIYMAPERFTGDWELSPTADIYSIGLLLVQLSSGRLPFTFGEVDPISEIFNGALQKNSIALLENASRPFGELCLDCINPDFRRRVESFEFILQKLERMS